MRKIGVMKNIGLHIRINNNIKETIEKALRLKLPFFQNFLIAQATGKYLMLSPQDKQEFLRLRREHFNHLFLHGSYWINGAAATGNQQRLLKRELAVAQELEFTHYIFHPGSARGCAYKEDGIDNLARLINDCIKRYPKIKIVLENTAHGNMCVGSDLQDFHAVLEKISHPDAIAFCIDTAHAHAYGYDLREDNQHLFFDIIAQLGFERIAVIHLNDASESSGSKIDRHERLGAGHIGEGALASFINFAEFKDIPILLELPELTEDEEIRELDKVRNWIR